MQGDCEDDQLVTLCQSAVDRYDTRKGRALHLGCGAGYVSFMLTKIFENVIYMVIDCRNYFACLVKVVGLDYCGIMIAAAQKLQSGNAIEYSENQVAQIPLGKGVDHSQVQFVQVCVCMYAIIHTPQLGGMGSMYMSKLLPLDQV